MIRYDPQEHHDIADKNSICNTTARIERAGKVTFYVILGWRTMVSESNLGLREWYVAASRNTRIKQYY